MNEAAAFCRVDDPAEFGVLESLISLAREKVELRTGRALISQQFQLTASKWHHLWHADETYRHRYGLIIGILSLWPSWTYNGEHGVIFFERAPVLSVDSVQYYDTTNTLQTWPTGDYYQFGIFTPVSGGLNPDPMQAGIALNATQGPWPSLFERPDAVQIKFTAGYGTTPDCVPQTLRHAMRLTVKHFYDNRDAFVIGSGASIELPQGLNDLLDSRRSGGWVS